MAMEYSSKDDRGIVLKRGLYNMATLSRGGAVWIKTLESLY